MHKKWFWSVVWIAILIATLQGQSRESVLKAVGENPNWTPGSKPVEYDDTHIDALAGNRRTPVINIYGLVGATTQPWNGAEGPVRLTLYEMLDPSAAYGWFTIERDVDQPGFTTLPLGSEGFRLANRSYFWQSKYVVKLEGGARATEALARIVSENIFGRSQKPPASHHLPPNNLVSGTEKYFLAPESIDRKLELDLSKLGFEDSVEVASATYRVNGQSAHLVLLLYPTQQVAKKYADQWEARAPDDAPFRKRVGPLLALVRGSRDPALAQTILDPVNYETQVTWNEPPPDITVAEIIITIFTFIGIALFFTVIAGISFGGLRIFMKACYPDKVFDRAQDMEIIQLKLAQGVIRKELGE